MIKVYVKNCMIGSMFDIPKFYEMKQWCKSTFGKNLRRQPTTWQSRKEVHTSFKAGVKQFEIWAVFYFRNEQDANWFKIRWV